MAESLKTILMSALASKATPAESDTLIVGEGNVLKKISFSQLFTYLKDKLGINTLNTKITFVNQVCKGTGAEYIYINPPDTNNDYYLIGATNADWNACPVNIVAVSKQNSTHIVHFTGNIEKGKSVRILSMWTQAKYITFKS